MNEKTVVFITSSLSQPRIIKRILSIHNAGCHVKVYGYDRGIYNCNKFPDDITVSIIGQQKDGADYISKIRQIRRDVRNIVSAEGKDAIFYAFGMIPTWFLSKCDVRYVYEISDILYGYNKFKIIQPFAKQLDRKLIKKSFFTVVTSQGFLDYLFNGKSVANVVVQPNKLSRSLVGSPREPKTFNRDNITFAFIGAIRYTKTILRFARIIGEHFPNHQFHFYGESRLSGEFKKSTEAFNNVKYFGAYKNPEDLNSIYSNVDIVVACYEAENLNERIAEPNKLYEAMFFCKPIIVSKDTFLANQVNENKFGWVVDAYNDAEIIEFVKNISESSVSDIVKREMDINASTLIDDTQEIINRLHQ